MDEWAADHQHETRLVIMGIQNQYTFDYNIKNENCIKIQYSIATQYDTAYLEVGMKQGNRVKNQFHVGSYVEFLLTDDLL